MYSHFLHATMTETTIEMTSKWSFQNLLMGHYFVALKSPPREYLDMVHIQEAHK